MNKLFFYKNLDSRYIIYFFGIRIRIKHATKFKFKKIKESGLTKEKRDKKIIVSLTSYPARINTIHYTLNTLLTQSLKPDKIILWLSKSEFPNGLKDLPQNLIDLMNFGLSIEWVDDDIRSYKKLVYALEKYPNDIIITADDDVYYSSNMVESLYSEYLKNPKNIYVKRSVRLKLENNEVKNISSRKYFYQHIKTPTYFNQIMGGSGCLYPPYSLHKDSTNIEKIKTVVPTHDDTYFWAMAVLNKTKIKVVGGFDEDLLFIEGTQNVGLIHVNKQNSSGVTLEEAYKKIIKEYPEIITILGEEQNEINK